MATHKKIHRLRKEERWDELERAIADGEHSRAARIQANSRQVLAKPKRPKRKKRASANVELHELRERIARPSLFFGYAQPGDEA